MNLKRAACQAMANAIAAAVPELAGRAHAVSAEPDDYAEFPSLYVIPHKFDLETGSMDDEVDDTPDDSVVVDVGSFVGHVELRLSEAYPSKREALEQKVLDVLMSREGSPGLYVTTIPSLEIGGIATTAAAPASFMLESADWQEEFSFEKCRYSFLDLVGEWPALIRRTGVSTIQQLVLAIRHGINVNVESETDTGTESYSVDDEGTVSEEEA